MLTYFKVVSYLFWLILSMTIAEVLKLYVGVVVWKFLPKVMMWVEMT